jgi:hypothetical protein
MRISITMLMHISIYFLEGIDVTHDEASISIPSAYVHLHNEGRFPFSRYITNLVILYTPTIDLHLSSTMYFLLEVMVYTW